MKVVSDHIIEAIEKQPDTPKIRIDGFDREIRTYGHQGIILLNWDDPRAISFEEPELNYAYDIVFENYKFVMTMTLKEGYKEFTLDNKCHKIKLGFPSREIFIDNKGYQCYFTTNKPTFVHLEGQRRNIHIDGKKPNVYIKESKDYRFLAGRIEMIVDEDSSNVHKVYLDARPQIIKLSQKVFIVIKFILSFKQVIINGDRFDVQFGGSPIAISIPIKDSKNEYENHFISFAGLPEVVVPGEIKLVGMQDDEKIFPNYFKYEENCMEFNLSVASSKYLNLPPPIPPNLQNQQSSICTNIRMPDMMQDFNTRPEIIPFSSVNLIDQPSSLTVPIYSPQSLFSIPPPPIVPISDTCSSLNTNSDIPNKVSQNLQSSSLVNKEPVVNVNSLIQSLYRTGIIDESKTSGNKYKSKELDKRTLNINDNERESDKNIPENQMYESRNLKKRRKYLIKDLYNGMQCSSCGVRYQRDQTEEYSIHLDWHFRQEKKQRDSKRY